MKKSVLRATAVLGIATAAFAGVVGLTIAAPADFDQGIDVHRIVEGLRGAFVPALSADFAPRRQPVDILKRTQPQLHAAGHILPTGVMAGILVPAWEFMTNARRDARYGSLPQDVLTPLEARFDEVRTVRDTLLLQAAGLEQQDDGLEQRYVLIKKAQIEVEQKVTEVSGAIVKFNSDCVGHPLPDGDPLNCRTRHAELSGKKQIVDDMVGRFNRRSDVFNADMRDVKTLIDVWDGSASTWFDSAVQLGKDIGAAIKAQVVTCTDKEIQDRAEAMHRICDETKWRCNGAQSCEQLKVNLAQGMACHAARKKIMDECYGGGDPRHEQPLRDVQTGIDNCLTLIGRRCGAGVSSGVPW